jgi:glycosyltransferase involved in cell wall biosynthesis
MTRPSRDESVSVHSPRVSVLMIVFNEESTIRVALASLLAQTFQDWECVIIDDASTDGTAHALSALRDDRFRVFRSERPLGRGGARQKALSLAQGEFIGTLDGDDFYFPQKLERQVAILEGNPSLTATVTGMFLCTQRGEPIGKAIGYWAPGLKQLSAQLQHLRIPFAAVLYRASDLGESRYDESFVCSEDQDFFTRFLVGKRVQVTDDHLYAYRWLFLAEDVLAGLRQSERLYRSLWQTAPGRSLLYLLYTRLKFWSYQAISTLGLWEVFKRIRYRAASRQECAELRDVLAVLESQAESVSR